MLRASVEAMNGEVDLSFLTEGVHGDSSSVAFAAALTAFAEAVVRGDSNAIMKGRNALVAAADAAIMVDAAGVIGNFERMTRIADATGIPLDAPSLLASADFRGQLGLERFAS